MDSGRKHFCDLAFGTGRDYHHEIHELHELSVVKRKRQRCCLLWASAQLGPAYEMDGLREMDYKVRSHESAGAAWGPQVGGGSGGAFRAGVLSTNCAVAHQAI